MCRSDIAAHNRRRRIIAAALDTKDGQGPCHGVFRLRFAYGQVTLGQVPNNGAPMQPVLLITRPAPDGARFARHFDGVRVVLSPLQRIDPVEAVCDAQAVVFTSTNGVAQAHRLGLSAVRAWCVGDRTAADARAAGFDAISARGTVEDLLELILAARPTIPIAHIRGRDARGDLAPRLRAAGIDCADCIAYAQTPLSLTAHAITAIEGADPVIIPLFSPRAATLLLGQVTLGPKVRLVAISQAVAKAALPHDAIVAAKPDGQAMLDATQSAIAAL